MREYTILLQSENGAYYPVAHRVHAENSYAAANGFAAELGSVTEAHRILVRSPGEAIRAFTIEPLAAYRIVVDA
jgi:hypothetical protein